MVPHALDDLSGQFDYLICNSLIEGLKSLPKI